jgi:beta-lactamase superfamily II metal-dependent hydrolase
MTMRNYFLAAALSMAVPVSAAPAQDLRIVSTDVEGAAAVLMRTPEGKSVLIDTGWAPGQGGPNAASLPTSADRIAAAAASLGITRIDYLIMTHYHADHLGGLEALLAKFPVGTFIDHGPNREPMRPNLSPQQRGNAPEARYPAWVQAWQGHPHISAKVGQVLDIGALKIQFVASDGDVQDGALPGAGQANPACANVPAPPRVGGDENNRSLGMLMTFGKTRILNLGDLTWEKEIALLCPANKVGKVDVYFVTGHGMDLSSSPPTAALEPRIAIMQNGPLKGGDADVIRTVESYPGLQGFWRAHDTSRYPALNGDGDTIANRDGVPDAGNPITLDITPAGAITVTNSRNGFSKTYQAR